MHKDLTYLPQLPLSHSLPTPTLTQTHTDTNTECNCSLQKFTLVHPVYDIALHMNLCLLDILTPLSNNFNRLFNAHELGNIRVGMTRSEDTACIHQIVKIDLDYLHLYIFSTRPTSIQEISEYKLIT